MESGTLSVLLFDPNFFVADAFVELFLPTVVFELLIDLEGPTAVNFDFANFLLVVANAFVILSRRINRTSLITFDTLVPIVAKYPAPPVLDPFWKGPRTGSENSERSNKIEKVASKSTTIANVFT